MSDLSVGSQSEGQLSCCDVRAESPLRQDLRDVARDRSFKHVYICSRRLSPVAKASAKELNAPAATQLRTIQSELRPLEGSAKRGRLRGFGLSKAAPRLRSWSEAGSAASV